MIQIRKRTRVYFWSCLLFCYGVSAVQAQENDRLLIAGEKHHLYSKVLEEDRPFWVHLPENYMEANNGVSTYPVIYLLDAELNFLPAAGVQASFHRGGRSAMPQAIIVGIVNTNRTRDLTPTKAISEMGGATLENSGGGEQFAAFMEAELIPYIDSAYTTSNRRILIGHSFGGLTAISILLNHTAMFSDYLAIDPSLWWDDGLLLSQSTKLLATGAFQGVNLYVAKAGDGPDVPPDGSNNALSFEAILEHAQPAALTWKYDRFAEENHGSVVLPAILYGLKFLYTLPPQGDH